MDLFAGAITLLCLSEMVQIVSYFFSLTTDIVFFSLTQVAANSEFIINNILTFFDVSSMLLYIEEFEYEMKL